ncbi:MAG: energy transducer TonB [Candidatus Sulfotelmatobacter sp.]
MSTATEVREPEVEEREVQAPVKARRAFHVPSSPVLVLVGPLFTDVLLEVDGMQRRRHTLATVLSFVLQCLLLGGLLLVPLLFTEALPRQQLLSFLETPPPPPPPPPAASEAASKAEQRMESDIENGRLRAPGRIPQKVKMIQEEEPPVDSSSGGVIGGVPGGIPGGQLGGVIGGIISSTSTLSAVPKLAIPAAPKRVRISQGVTKGMLIQKIEPAYPPLARAARIQGEVVLAAIISKNGEIQNLTLVSGHPMLTAAALEAVKQWRYRPYLLNGEPVEVETTIIVTFQLSSG